MKIILGSDKEGHDLKNTIKDYLTNNNYEVVDVSEEPSEDFVDSTEHIIGKLNENEEDVAIAFDAYGAGSFIVASKFKGIRPAEVADEHSAYMTRRHNNARMITLGSGIIGKELAKSIVSDFVSTEYDGGRHQVRVDMLNEMN